jgi:Domain of unknown function (DUF4328)
MSVMSAPHPPEFLPLRGLGHLLTWLLALVVALAVVQLALRVSAVTVASGLRSRLDEAGGVALFVTAIVFVLWFRRARINAESSGWPQRRARGWTIWAWIVPIANLFVPFQLMADIWHASLPAGERGGTALLPGLWWAAWLLSGTFVGDQPYNGPQQPHVVPWLCDPSLNLGALAVSGVLLIPIIRTVGAGPAGAPPAAT